MTDGQLEDWPGFSGGELPVERYSAALSAHVLERSLSGAASAWELQLWPARLDELVSWLCLPAETPVWQAPLWPDERARSTRWGSIDATMGELVDGLPSQAQNLPLPFLLDPQAVLQAADRVALSVQDGAHAAVWTRDPQLLLAAARGFVAERTASRPHPRLLAELIAPLPLGHAWRLHTSRAVRDAAAVDLEMELVGGEHEIRCSWTASTTGVWLPRRVSAG